MATKDTATRVADIVGAWERMRPTKSFWGMTVEDFKKQVQPFMDARARIADLERQVQDAVSKRDTAEPAAVKAVKSVVNAVKGDLGEGEEGELYSAMGYIPISQRSSGLKRPRKEEPPKGVTE